MLTANILKKGEAFSGYRKKLSTAEDIYQRERFFNGENYFPQKNRRIVPPVSSIL
jgi:hypothetical protein